MSTHLEEIEKEKDELAVTEFPASLPREFSIEGGLEDLLSANVGLLCDKLKAMGGQKLTASYSGSWDSSDFIRFDHDCDIDLPQESMFIYDADMASEGDAPLVKIPVDKACEKVIDQILSKHHEDYTYGAGGNGEIVFDAHNIACTVLGFDCHEVDADVIDSGSSSDVVVGEDEENRQAAWPSPEQNDSSGELKLRILFDELKYLGAKSVTVDYSGGGDSGDVGDTVCNEIDLSDNSLQFNSVNSLVNSGNSVSIMNALREVTFDMMSRHHSGFENNEGGGGSVVFDIENGTVTWSGYYNPEPEYKEKARDEVTIEGKTPSLSSAAKPV